MSTEERETAGLPVAVTPEAATRLRPLLESRANGRGALRVKVEPGGCAGLRYAVSIEALPVADSPAADVVIESRGVRICLAPEAEPLLRGAVIDFQASGFSVRNPNARGVCSCGGTFASTLWSEGGSR